jgi:hypothetical protein
VRKNISPIQQFPQRLCSEAAVVTQARVSGFPHCSEFVTWTIYSVSVAVKNTEVSVLKIKMYTRTGAQHTWRRSFRSRMLFKTRYKEETRIYVRKFIRNYVKQTQKKRYTISMARISLLSLSYKWFPVIPFSSEPVSVTHDPRKRSVLESNNANVSEPHLGYLLPISHFFIFNPSPIRVAGFKLNNNMPLSKVFQTLCIIITIRLTHRADENDTKLSWNVGQYLLDYTEQQPRR